jgi:hypothetical protein
MADMTTERASAINDLQRLLTEMAGQPEITYTAIVALADEIKRQGENPGTESSIRLTAMTVKPMIGLAAGNAWDKLSWLEKYRNRKRVDQWKQEHTDALLAEGTRRVQAVLKAHGLSAMGS